MDLVQLHWWDYNIPGMVDAALMLAELREEGSIKQVGQAGEGVGGGGGGQGGERGDVWI